MSYVRLQIEETPRPEGAVTTTPYRISTVSCDMPITSFRIAPGPGHLDRSDELRNFEGSVSRLIDAFEPDGAIAERMYLNNMVFLMQISGFVSTITVGAGTAATPGINSTTATGVNAINSTTINVASTVGFPDVGSLSLAGGTAFAYTGKTATSFTGCGSHAATAGGETIVDVLPTGAIKHVFNKRGGSVAKTAQLIAAYSDQSVFFKGQGFGVQALSFSAAGEVTADLAGLVFLRTTDPSITPAIDAGSIVPMRRADMTLSWLTGSGETDDFSVSIANPLVRRKTFGMTTRSYYSDKMFHGDDRVAVTGSIPKYTLATADIDALLAASVFVGTARWRSDRNIGATSYPYSMDLAMPACQLVGGSPDELGNQRRRGASYDWFAAWDETLGYDARVSIVCSITAIETYI